MEKGTENDILPDGESQVSRLLSSLPRVAAPGDFDVRVRARIAKGRPAAVPRRGLPAAIVYAFGLGAALIAITIGGYVWVYNSESGAVPAVAESAPARVVTEPMIPATKPEIAAVSNVEVASKPLKQNDAQLALRPVPEGPLPANTEVKPNDAKTDQAVRSSRSVYPKGINPNIRTTPGPNDIVNGPRIQAKDVLSLLGANATFDGSGWRVDSVNANSSAERYGLKQGDVVVAVNDQGVKSDTTFAGSFTGKSLKIIRNGKAVRVALAEK